MLATIYFVVIIGLIVLFFISFFLFIKRNSRNSAIRKNETVANGEKLDRIMEQNEKIISLLENDK